MDENRIDGVVLGDDVRLFRFTAPVFDFQDDIKDAISEGPVAIYNDSDQIIGYAGLILDGDRVLAAVSLGYACPERLTIETASEPLYLVAVGQPIDGVVVVERMLLTRVPYVGTTNVCSLERL